MYVNWRHGVKTNVELFAPVIIFSGWNSLIIAIINVSNVCISYDCIRMFISLFHGNGFIDLLPKVSGNWYILEICLDRIHVNLIKFLVL